ncbi:MAG: DUF3105 domain-containing protein [Myxococcota bacterium]
MRFLEIPRAAVLLLAACGVPSEGVNDLGFGAFDGGTCTASVSQVAVPGASHVAQGSPLTFTSNPPAGGDHYPDWLHWTRLYDVAQRGNYVHNAEHGGVVLLSPCASTDCPELTEALRSIGRGLPQDPICPAPINARWLVVHDPDLPPGLGVAAMAWGWTFTAPCLDQAKLQAFIAEHYGHGPEALCFDGRL